MLKKVLVTGSNGFIGRIIADYLMAYGYQVHGLNRRPALPGSMISRSYVCDIRDEESLKKIIHAHHWDAIVHAAAIVDYDDFNMDISTTNIIGTHNLLKCSYGPRGIKKTDQIVYLSSIGVIGKPMQDPITEEHPINPVGFVFGMPYGIYQASKFYGEVALQDRGIYQVPTSILRLSPPIGRNMDPNKILPTFVRKALANEDIIIRGKGTRRQDYIDVRDVARAVRGAIAFNQGRQDYGIGMVYNIASGKAISNIELAKRVVRRLNSDSAIIFEGFDEQDDVVYNININRAQSALAFAPSFTLEQTIDSIRGHCHYGT